MKELRIKVSDSDYRKLMEVARMDAEEYGEDVKEQFRRNNLYMVESFLQTNCSFWDID